METVATFFKVLSSALLIFLIAVIATKVRRFIINPKKEKTMEDDIIEKAKWIEMNDRKLNKAPLTIKEAYDKTEILLLAYEDGDVLGGDPMQHIKAYVKRKCEEQRNICATEAIKNFYLDDSQLDIISNSPEPNFD